MARYTVPSLMLSALGDVLGAPVTGAAQGALLAPQVQGQYQDIRLREQEAPLRLAALQQQLAQQGQSFPLRQQFMQAEIERMRRPEILQNQWGAYAYGPQGLKEIPLPKPQFEQTADGWTKVTDPTGRVTWQPPGVTPERMQAAQTELKSVKPNDIGSMLIWANKYPEFSGGVEKYMEAYRKAQSDASLDAYRRRMAGAAETRAAADVIRARRTGALAGQPTITSRTTPGKPITNPAEMGLATKTFQDLVGTTKPGTGWFGGGQQYVPGALADLYQGFGDPKSLDAYDPVVGTWVPKDAVIRYEMAKRGYDVTPRFNRATGQWEMLAIGHAPQTVETTKSIGPSREVPEPGFAREAPDSLAEGQD